MPTLNAWAGTCWTWNADTLGNKRANTPKGLFPKVLSEGAAMRVTRPRSFSFVRGIPNSAQLLKQNRK